MANIYLKLPWYIAAFYRGLDEEHQLTEFEPFVYTEYTSEYVLMANNLRYIPEQIQSRLCYSQRAWNNILHGRRPDGGELIINRDHKTWPTTQELCTLTNTPLSNRMKTTDYLAVQMPKEVWRNKKFHRTNDSFALSYDTAQQLCKMLSQEFYHVFLDWFDQNERFCNQVGIRRKNLEIMEQFLEQYNIPIIVDSKEMESLRRMRNRWMANAKKRPNDRVNFNHIWLRHASDEELRKAEKYKKKKTT